MIRKTAVYRVRPEEVAEAVRLNEEFVAAVRAEEPGTLLYETLQEAGDETRFLNVMAFVDEEAERRHRGTPHVARFVEGLYPRCVEQPAFTDFRTVASTRDGT